MCFYVLLMFCLHFCFARVDDKVQSDSPTAEELNAWDDNGKTIDGKL